MKAGYGINNTHFWDVFNENGHDYFKLWVLQEKQSFSLELLYGAFFSSPILKERYQLSDNPEDIKNREKLLSYLSELLKKSEVKMRIFDMSFEICYKEDGSQYLNCSRTNPRDFSGDDYKLGIELLREKWFSFEVIDHRNTYEFIGVLFVLPDGEFLY